LAIYLEEGPNPNPFVISNIVVSACLAIGRDFACFKGSDFFSTFTASIFLIATSVFLSFC